MDIALCVCLCVHRVENVHLVEFLSADRTVLEHSTHSGITVDISVFTLEVGILGRLEGKILIDLHKPCIHLSCTGPLGTVKDISLCSRCMTFIYKDLFNAVLDLLDSRRGHLLFHKHIYDLAGKCERFLLIGAAD